MNDEEEEKRKKEEEKVAHGDEKEAAHGFSGLKAGSAFGGSRGREEKPCAKCDEYLNGWKRALADYDNLKKELSGERTHMRHAAIEQCTHQLIPVLDHFDQALYFKPTGLDANTENWLQGVLHVRTQLESVLVEMGLESFGKEGDVFDPHVHEAASEEAHEGVTSGTIVQVAQRGWKRGDQILRPAKVIISK